MNKNIITLRNINESKQVTHFAITEGSQENFAFGSQEELEELIGSDENKGTSEVIGPKVVQHGKISEISDYRVIDWVIPQGKERKS
tara:strand:- start:570 stop:827 length:258 start_codon:yes stop_codon:yes gene_type:complete